jgi:hypothetical protein
MFNTILDMSKHITKRKDFFQIGEILKDSMRTLRRPADTQMLKIWDCWENVIPSPVSENARPAAFRDSELIVHVGSSTWIQHLQFHKQDLIARLNKALGTDTIKTIKFKIGPL